MKTILQIVVLLLLPLLVISQKKGNDEIKSMLELYKKDVRGPYKDIRWFCQDGSTRPPQERCPKPGVQRARYKDEVVLLGQTNQVYLGQILATSDFTEFWDAGNNHSKLKQYQLEKFLFRTDNGWILRKGQYYRGAIQAEDEEAWGIEFFKWLLADNEKLDKNFYLIREALKDIPHKGDDSKTQLIRALSKEISDSVPAFLNIRIKIHGQPDDRDLATVKKFRDGNKGTLSPLQQKNLEELISNMEMVYRPLDLSSLNKYLKNIDKTQEPGKSVVQLMEQYNMLAGPKKIMTLAETLLSIRRNLGTVPSSSGRLALMDISNNLGEILFREMKVWPNKTPDDLLKKIYYLGAAAAGSGYLELWEWEQIEPLVTPPSNPSLSLNELTERMDHSRRLVEWSSGMTRAIYKDAVLLVSGFEPLALGFEDDRIRSTLLLNLGECVSELGEYFTREANFSSTVMNIRGQSHIRGINPGYALGELAVLKEITEKTELDPSKIYIFSHAPADLKPVAGIATVSEGNLVSHVQLLARNLGIPNAVLSADNLEQLLKYHGQKVFYAVSNKGTVIMKPAGEMTLEERNLFTSKKRSEERVAIPTQNIDLVQTNILSLHAINASHSGFLCGPKAANLGQLKKMFPDHVVDGLVIPFGIFRQHMNQTIPGKSVSYWEFLMRTFKKAEDMQKKGSTQAEIDDYVLSDLKVLQNAIQAMPLLPGFIEDLENTFREILKKPMGEVAVFLRSDTNMEDLKDFTGAGLNLTLFNVLDKDKILQGIKDVWASPYTERSYKWRQRFLLNPENVFPSILVIPSVDVDFSGVLITRGLISFSADDLTIAFSRGAGGAVEGQAAESYLLRASGEDLLTSPAREPFYTRLPASGGTAKKAATFEKPILNANNLAEIRRMAGLITKKMASQPSQKGEGPHDVELGFKDNKLWLFQIRPFVENKNASKTEYLNTISPVIPGDKMIKLNASL